MTLLDAPEFDAARERRKRIILYSAAGAIFVLFVAWWLVAGRPVDWPWNWDNYIFWRAAAILWLRMSPYSLSGLVRLQSS